MSRRKPSHPRLTPHGAPRASLPKTKEFCAPGRAKRVSRCRQSALSFVFEVRLWRSGGRRHPRVALLRVAAREPVGQASQRRFEALEPRLLNLERSRLTFATKRGDGGEKQLGVHLGER